MAANEQESVTDEPSEAESEVIEPIAEEAIAPLLPDVAQQWAEANPQVSMWIGLGVLLGVAIVGYLLVAGLLGPVLRMAMKRTRTWWDETLVDHKVFQRLVPLLSAFIIHWGITLVPHLPEVIVIIVQRIALATIVVVIVRSFSALLGAINAIYTRYPAAKGRPIKGYLQVAKVLAYIAATVMVIAILMDREPWLFLSGLGAMTAVLLLIFRDTILSLVAGVQLAGNDLLRVGDWIAMPQFNADGDVVDISLNVVRVQNFDRTFTVIPTHKFLEHSFRNYRSMYEAGGRRMKRPIHIDMTTIRFLTQDEIDRYSRVLLLKDYIKDKVDEIERYNREHCPDEESRMAANTRQLTNIGTFRAYALNYLKTHPKVNKDLTIMVRHLEPTPAGLPLEIYGFANDTRWPQYETIQADIFDHLLAVAPEFGLRVYQQPSGNDLLALAVRAE